MTDQLIPPPVTDHREAKAQAKAAKAHAKAMRPWFKKKRFLIPLVLLAFVIAGTAASGGDDATVAANDPAAEADADSGAAIDSSSGNQTNPPQNDVAMEECTIGEFGYIDASVRVTNNSSERSMYFIDVVFEDEGGNQIDSGFTSVDNLEPGQSTVSDVAVMAEPAGAFSCRIVEVERMSDES